MSSVTTHTEVEAPSQAGTAPQARPSTEPISLPVRRAGLEDRWPFIAMILSLCLFAAVFAKTVLQPAADTVTSMSNDHVTEGP